MQQILELIHTDGASELWRPTKPSANLMQISDQPRVGDFLVDNGDGSHFLRPEAMHVKIKSVENANLALDLVGHEVPNWFMHLMHTHQINFDNNIMNLNGHELKAGFTIVFDGVNARVEEGTGEVVTHH